MPINRRSVSLGDIAEFLSGGTPSTQNADFWNGSIPWVSAKDLKSFRLHDTEDHLTDTGVRNGTRVVPAGTVLILVRGMTLLNDVPISVVHRSMAFNQDLKAVIPHPTVDPEYLPYLLLANRDRLLSLVDLAGHGTGRLNLDELKALPVSLPTLPEQRTIAKVLGALDDKIELNRRMSETLETMARALFKSWFVDFDPARAKAEGRWRKGESLRGLPAHLYDVFPDSLEDAEIGEVPSGWSVKGLDEIARFLNGLALQKHPPIADSSLPVIKIAQLRAGNTRDSDLASSGIPPEYIIEDGDVLFSWSGSLECVLWTGGAGALNQHLFKVSSNIFPKWFYYSWIHRHLPEFRRIAAAKATTMGHIQRHHLTEARVVVPPIGMLDSLSRYFDPLIEELILNSLESRTLSQLRDNLLPKLVSGELRLMTN